MSRGREGAIFFVRKWSRTALPELVLLFGALAQSQSFGVASVKPSAKPAGRTSL